MFIIKEGTPAEKIGEGTPPEVLEAITKHLEKTGHVIRTTDQEKNFLSQHTQTEVDKVLGERNRQFEATIFETTGIQKQANEKFYDYHKRALTDKLAEVKGLQEKIAEFEQKGLQGSDLAKQYKTELENTQKQIQTLNQEWEGKLKAKDEEVFSTKINTDVEKEVSELKAKIDPTIPPHLHGDIISARLAKFNAENKAASLEGMIVWKNAKGETIIDTKSGKPKNLKEILPTYFGDVIKEQRQQGGAGSGGQGNNGGTPPAKWKEIALPTTVTSQVKLTDFLMKEAKLDPSSKEYSEAFEGLKGTLPLK